jgi:hypothetical protein
MVKKRNKKLVVICNGDHTNRTCFNSFDYSKISIIYDKGSDQANSYIIHEKSLKGKPQIALEVTFYGGKHRFKTY